MVDGSGSSDYPQISWVIHYTHAETNQISAVAAVLASQRAEPAGARSSLKTGSQSQCHVFRASMAGLMLFASSTRPQKNSSEIVPFRRSADYPLERITQRMSK
jgi:hypothetical protein